MQIHITTPKDASAVFSIIAPVIRAGETYMLPREMTEAQALAYWFAPEHEVRVAKDDGEVVGTYYMRPNQKGGGGHVVNCGYMTAANAQGKGIARAMCLDSLARAKERGFRTMQFNAVISTNTRAVKLWQSLGFDIAGRLQEAFLHPAHGYVDAYVMYRKL